MDLDSLCVELEAVLGDQEFLNIFALITLKLDHLAHLTVRDDCAIAGEFLLDDFEDLLLVEFLRKALDGGQSLTTIALLDTNVDVILGLLRFPSVVVGLREGVCETTKSAMSHTKSL
ncbi:hypothetical protein PHISCL_10626 [Aspergillus sclerotialis]|uniref:Uncharacterized protein n=1 Tax=Aspergillus sclerotialis TaxID=2070753 RepID=A0A3A2Z6U5_9EURO|nr:hypothetical protein PHISCL_10626 [Aspergillus sclerotialis]